MEANTTSAATATFSISYRIRALFYSLTPEETYIEHPKDVPNIQLAAFPVIIVMVAIELLVLRARGKGDNFHLHSAVINSCVGALNEATGVFIFHGIEFAAYLWVYTNLKIMDLAWDSPLTYIIALLGVDFCNYWWHRLAHELSFMWASHSPHHSSEDLNISVSGRVSFTMRPFKWVYFLPCALLGMPPSIFLVHSQLGYVYGAWVHCQAWPKTHKIIPVLGHIFEFIFATPSHHRVHHGVNKYAIDKNFGNVLIIWDRLFGTFAEEREDETLTYGIISQKDNNHIIGVVIDPWRDLWSRVSSADSFLDKLKTLVYGPGWTPGQPRLGDKNAIPDVTGRKKHTFEAPRWVSIYLAGHALLIILMYFDTGARVAQFTYATQLLIYLYMLVSYSALGGLYSFHASMWLEPLRLVASVPMLLLLPLHASERFTTTVLTINLLSLLLWPALKNHVLLGGKKVD